MAYSNPAYAAADFLLVYPKFGSTGLPAGYGQGGFGQLATADPFLPTTVLNAYIALANASLDSSLWGDAWPFAMAFYVAHFATLWLTSEGGDTSAAGKVAASGMARGVQVSKSVGDVSVSYAPPPRADDWACWNITTYGQQLMSLARMFGAGPRQF